MYKTIRACDTIGGCRRLRFLSDLSVRSSKIVFSLAGTQRYAKMGPIQSSGWQLSLIMGKFCGSSVSSGFTDPPISTILPETSNHTPLNRLGIWPRQIRSIKIKHVCQGLLRWFWHSPISHGSSLLNENCADLGKQFLWFSLACLGSLWPILARETWMTCPTRPSLPGNHQLGEAAGF